MCVCLRNLQRKASNHKKDECWDSVCRLSQNTVVPLWRHWITVVFCSVTHSHTHTRASELMWYDLPDQGTTGRHNDRRFSLTSASHLLFIVSCSLARLWTLSASQLTCHHFLQLSSNPIHASSSPSPTRLFLQSFNSSCLYRSLCILPSPTIIHSLHFPHSLSSPTLVLSLLSRPPRLCSLPASLSAVWHSFVVCCWFVLSRSLDLVRCWHPVWPLTHTLAHCWTSSTLCVCSVWTMTQCTLCYFSHNASILNAPPPPKKALCNLRSTLPMMQLDSFWHGKGRPSEKK